MRYEFDTEVARGLTIAQLGQEETILCEIFEHIRLLRRQKEQVAVDREKAKKGVWVDKHVAARRAV